MLHFGPRFSLLSECYRHVRLRSIYPYHAHEISKQVAAGHIHIHPLLQISKLSLTSSSFFSSSHPPPHHHHLSGRLNYISHRKHVLINHVLNLVERCASHLVQQRKFANMYPSSAWLASPNRERNPEWEAALGQTPVSNPLLFRHASPDLW